MSKGGSIPMNGVDKKWQAECDARTLADAKVIEADASRKGAAIEAARKMAEEKTKEAAAMRNVASSSSGGGSKKSRSGGIYMMDTKVRMVK